MSGWARGPGALKLAIAGACLLAAVIAIPLGSLLLRFHRLYYIHAESMAPTFKAGDRFVARMGRPETLRRGDIVIILAPSGSHYIQRVAALPGDRIELIGGIVFLNGRAVYRRRIGTERIGDESVSRFQEQFPGEARPHQIYDYGYLPSVDDVPPLVIGPNQIFLLGDNRDRSADSRVSAAQEGMGGARSLDHIRGVPWRFTWSEGHAVGEPVGH